MLRTAIAEVVANTLEVLLSRWLDSKQTRLFSVALIENFMNHRPEWDALFVVIVEHR